MVRLDLGRDRGGVGSGSVVARRLSLPAAGAAAAGTAYDYVLGACRANPA